MAVSYEIVPDLGIVYVRYWGVATVQETLETFGRFTQDPDFHPDLKHLIDLSCIVEYERSFPELMKLQAYKADTVMQGRGPSYMVYFAPNRLSQAMARTILKSWDGLSGVIGRVAQGETEALEMLGLQQRSFADLPMNRA
jgi:hypothetical protein